MQQLHTPSIGSSADSAAWELLNAALPLTWFIRRKMRVHRKGLSVPSFRALAQIGQKPQQSLSAVGDHLGVSLPTASRIIAGLVNKGLIERADCKEDRRQVNLRITDKGDAVLQNAWRATQDELAKEVRSLTSEQLATVTSAMQSLKSVFGSLVHNEGVVSSVNEQAMCSKDFNRKEPELAAAQ